ncbi:hypothetical protein MNBD_GAMMA20-2427 [hydrothermal vent metagenome]|uniref:Uncharacterized protein n=1 Tax=hydrothermal vent metagenome TaxID=652676 RepID=A0A3B1AA86_9ZZZZ
MKNRNPLSYIFHNEKEDKKMTAFLHGNNIVNGLILCMVLDLSHKKWKSRLR